MPVLPHSPAPVNTGAPPPCPCGGDRLVYREPGLPPILVCLACHGWTPTGEPLTPVTEGR